MGNFVNVEQTPLPNFNREGRYIYINMFIWKEREKEKKIFDQEK